MDFQHIPVLKDEVIEGLNIDPHGVYVDGTLGGGGHSGEILKRLEDGFLVGIDRDESALKAAEKHLQSIGGSFQLVKGNFVDMPAILKALHIDKVDGILLDIGVLFAMHFQLSAMVAAAIGLTVDPIYFLTYIWRKKG